MGVRKKTFRLKHLQTRPTQKLYNPLYNKNESRTADLYPKEVSGIENGKPHNDIKVKTFSIPHHAQIAYYSV